jgi:hypothetical protein
MAQGKRGIQVKVVEAEDGIQIHLIGTRASGFNVELLQACVQNIFTCADRNLCFDRGLTITENCFRSLVGHDMATKCMTEGFGLAKTG